MSKWSPRFLACAVRPPRVRRGAGRARRGRAGEGLPRPGFHSGRHHFDPLRRQPREGGLRPCGQGAHPRHDRPDLRQAAAPAPGRAPATKATETTVLDGYDAWDLLAGQRRPVEARPHVAAVPPTSRRYGRARGRTCTSTAAKQERGRGRGQGARDRRWHRLRARGLRPRAGNRLRALLRPGHRPPGVHVEGAGDDPRERRDPRRRHPVPQDGRQRPEDRFREGPRLDRHL